MTRHVGFPLVLPKTFANFFCTNSRLTHRDMLSYGFKPGEPWGDQRRELERAFDAAPGAATRTPSMTSRGTASSREYQGSNNIGYARHSGYASPHHNQLEYAPRHTAYSPAAHSTHSQDLWMQYRDHNDSFRRSVSSRTSSPMPSNALGSYGRSHSYGYGYAASPSYAQSPSSRSGYSGHGYSRSSSTGYASQPSYYSDDDDNDYTPAPSSVSTSEPYFESGYAETTYIVEPSDSAGSESYYSGDHSSYEDSEYGSQSTCSDSCSGHSESDEESDYSEDQDGDYDDDESYSDDGGYYSDE
ncbi:hypothetical protein C8J57DRAFT_1294766 [Mycena rebaudengoi]|nr:hypothetical protein C8J57DRAFT_1294766 [Mycena rebaudengoi]